MGIKVDAVPGRLNQIVTIPTNLGVYYGQCSELCGVSHGFMPIKVSIINLNDYFNWINSKESINFEEYNNLINSNEI